METQDGRVHPMRRLGEAIDRGGRSAQQAARSRRCAVRPGRRRRAGAPVIRRVVLPVLCLAAVVGGCSNGDTPPLAQNADAGETWQSWHAGKRGVDRVVDAAINEPDGGNYAKAADAIRRSSRPPAVRQFELGQLIVGGIMEGARIRPPETLEQGLRMMEDSTVAPGQKDEGAVQQLRFLFERGDGKPPHAFPVNPRVATCWRAVEERRSHDPAACITMRRE